MKQENIIWLPLERMKSKIARKFSFETKIALFFSHVVLKHEDQRQCPLFGRNYI